MGRQILRLIIDSDIKNVYLISTAIEALCNRLSLSDDMAFGVRLSIAEAVNNCIIHAYGNEAGHDVEVVFAIEEDKVVIKVCDNGRPMNPDILSASLPCGFSDDEAECAEAAEISGRGIAIIKKLMNTVNYETNGEKNCLMMTRQKTG